MMMSKLTEQEGEQELEDAIATAFSIRDILIALGL